MLNLMPSAREIDVSTRKYESTARSRLPEGDLARELATPTPGEVRPFSRPLCAGAVAQTQMPAAPPARSPGERRDASDLSELAMLVIQIDENCMLGDHVGLASCPELAAPIGVGLSATAMQPSTLPA